MHYFLGILFLVLAVWQFYITYENFQRVRGQTGDRRSLLMLIALVCSIIFAITMVGIAIKMFLQ